MTGRMMAKRTLVFPCAVESGRISSTSGDDLIRGKIIEVLFTTPGESINLPQFGCGLFNPVFGSNDPILAAAMEFTIGQGLTRWLGDEIVADDVSVEALDASVSIEVSYTERQNLSRQAVRIHFR